MRTWKEGIILVTLLAVLFLSNTAWGVNCPIPDTGQTKCYDDSGEITCPSPGEDSYGQDANYVPCNPHSYTTLGGGIMVQDNVTGLIWEVKTDDGTIHDKDDTYTWQNAQDVFIATLNSENFGGHNDWRMPTVKELSTIVDSSMTNPSINTDYFPNTVSSGYWSSTTYVYDPSYAWYVYFFDGSVNYGLKSNDSYVRAVRSGQCGSFGDFVDNGDGTVTDNSTGLMWEVKTDDGVRDKDNRYTWEDALSYCENLTLADYDDWRLPNRNELQSLVDYSQYDPSIDPTYFPNTVSSGYWSSTTYVNDPDYAWGVYFSSGYVDYNGKSYSYYVRAVRSGQCGSFGDCSFKKIYGEDTEEVELLRYFRDNVLIKTPEGREIIRLYYQWSPVIVEVMEEDEKFKEQVKELIDEILLLIEEEAE